MIDCLDALNYEGCQQFFLFIAGDRPVNSSGEDNRNITCLDSVLNNAPDENIHNLRAGGRPSGVAYDEQHGFIRAENLFQGRRLNGRMQCFANVGIA
jgi:hypothetical protein